MNACDFGGLCDTIRIWKQGSGFRVLYVKKNYYSWYFQALNIDICESGIVSMGEEKYYKNDCLKIIMDMYKVIGSIGKGKVYGNVLRHVEIECKLFKK